MNRTLSIRNIIAGAIIVAALFAATSLTHAQSVDQTSISPGSFGSSNISDFQNAAFQQSGNSAANSAGGATQILKQVTTGTITVTGAPAVQPVIATQKSRAPLYWLLTIIAITGLILIGLFINKTRKTQASNETVFANEIVAEAAVAKTIAAAQEEPELENDPNPKKDKKPKKKNKKHHR